MVQIGPSVEREDQSGEILRVRIEDMKEMEFEDVTVFQYIGPKKPSMPIENAKQNTLPSEIEEMRKASYKRWAKILTSSNLFVTYQIHLSSPDSKLAKNLPS